MDPEAGTDGFRTAEDGTCRCLCSGVDLFGMFGMGPLRLEPPWGAFGPLSCLSFETGRDRSGRNLPPSALALFRFCCCYPETPGDKCRVWDRSGRSRHRGDTRGGDIRDSERRGPYGGNTSRTMFKEEGPYTVSYAI